MNLESISLQSNFTGLDWAIVIVYLAGTLVIGLCVKRYIANMSDYVVAGRALKSCLAIATMIGTELGLITIMYSAQKGFTGGFAAFHIAVVAAIVTLIVGLTGFIVVPLRKMRVMTIPEYYEKRFGRGVRILGGAVLAFSGILNMGMFLKAGSLFVTGITGMSQEESELTLKLVMTTLLALVLIYTILGGMVSVVITDYVQFVVLSFGLLAGCYFAIKSLGNDNILAGWKNVVDTVIDQKGQAGFNPFHAAGFGISYVIWMAFSGLGSCATWQTAVIRACSAESTKVVKKLYIWSSVGFLIRFMIPYFFGICAFVYMVQHTELKQVFLPAAGADPETTLMAMPIFLNQILPVGIIGIITAGMLAGFMSTHDSYLLCWSSVLTQDVIAPMFNKELSTKVRLFLTRIFIFLIGVFLLVWGLWYPLGEDLWDYMAVTGAIYGNGAFALLVLGIYWKRASKVGAYAALLCGFLALLGLRTLRETLGITWFDENWPPQKVSAIIVLFTVSLAVASMIIGSLLFPDKKSRKE